MIQKIEKDAVYESEHSWLHSRFLFSFAEYFDPDNLAFGNLRVFNDDSIQGKGGFGAHSHKEMEIVTIMHSGTLTHEDSMGNKRVLSSGFVQRMSAGTGVVHSEINHSDETVSLYQLWFFPREKGKKPSYEEKKFERKEGVIMLVSPKGEDDSVSIAADVWVYKVVIKEDEEMELPITSGDYALVYVRTGEMHIDGEDLKSLDQARIHDEERVKVFTKVGSEFFVIVTRG